MIRAIVIAALLLAASGTSGQKPKMQASDPSPKRSRADAIATMSLCGVLDSPELFDGKIVKVRANYGGTWEGFYLFDPSCSNRHKKGENAVCVAPYDDAVPPRYRVKFVDDGGARQFGAAVKLICNGMDMRCRYDYVTADFTGMIAVKRDFRVSGGFGNGFCHLSMSKTAIVLKSVANISPHDITAAPSTH